MFKIEIPKRKKCCHRCQSSFSEGETVISFLIQGELFERNDLCEVCFRKEVKHPSAVFWKGVCPPAKEEKKCPVDELEGAITLFNKIYTEERDSLACYALAHYLVRLRLFSFRKQIKKDGMTFDLFEYDGSDEIYAVPKATPDPEQAGPIQQQLRTQLQALSSIE